MTESVTDTPSTPSEYLTVAEVAGVFKVKERTVYRWIKDGDLAHVKVGGTVRIPRSALPALADEEAS